MAATRHNVRFKGVTLGAFTAAEVADKLRTGEISLSHAVERGGQWMTVRQFLQQAHAPAGGSTASPGLLERLTGKGAPPPPGGDHPPPPPGANPVADAIESRVRTGYLWCGLTFVLPLLAGLPTWSVTSWLTDRSAAQKAALTLAALAGAAYAAWRARSCAQDLVEEGLDDVGHSMQQLAVALAVASSIFWIAITCLWVVR